MFCQKSRLLVLYPRTEVFLFASSMAAEQKSAFSSPMKKCKRKRKRTHLDPEMERIDSLAWKSSFPASDPFSMFIGSNELEGGFLSLEEIDETQYGLEVPESVTGGSKFEKATMIAKKKDKNNTNGNKCEGGDESQGKVEEKVEREENVETTKRRKKNNNLNKIPNEEKILGVDGCSSNETGLKFEEKTADENNADKKTKKKKNKMDKGTEKTHGNVESDAGHAEKNAVGDNITDKKKKKLSIQTDQEDEELTSRKPVDETEFYAWNELRLHPLLMNSIYKLGFKEPTPIQKACIPAAAHQGKDVVGAAETGSGKTLAFGLPILQRLLEEREKAGRIEEGKEEDDDDNASRGLRALIITPTRELALQVTDHLKAVAEGTNTRVVPIVGGMSTEKQERLLRSRPAIIVGTPGRLWELMSGGEKHLVELRMLSFFVLDEADRMIENGHFHQLQSIIDMLPSTNGSVEANSQGLENARTTTQRKKRQTFVFSATLSLSADFRKKLKRGSERSKKPGSGDLNSIEALSERSGMRDNAAIIDLTNASILVRKLEESFIECREEDKDAYLYYILSIHGQGRTIVFCTSIAALRRVAALLSILGVNAYSLHAQKQQRSRLKAMDRFRSSENGTLIATDVAARGLDIPGVRTVIHYQLPHSAEVYVHRSGRTARASADGCSITLISPNETSKFVSLCKSFSKESFRQFPLDHSYIPGIMKRVSLARQIDKILRKGSQEKARKSWLEKNAESVEFEVDKDDSEEETVNNHKQRKAVSMQLKNLQLELNNLLLRPLQPDSFSHRYLAGAGVSPLLQDQFEELARQKFGVGNTGDQKRTKLMVIGQDCVEPIEALKSSRLQTDIKAAVERRRNTADLRRKRKQEKTRLRDQRRRQRKERKGKHEEEEDD